MKFFAFIVVAFPTLCLAGVMSGGGGKSVVCRGPQGQILSAELLDLYEGRIMYGRNIPESSLPIDDQVQAAFEKTPLNKTMGYHYSAYSIEKKMRLLPPGTQLFDVDDAVAVVAPLGCEIEQMMNYVNDNAIIVKSEIWNQLSNTQKAASLAHEAVYSSERHMNATDSRRTRNIISMLFSDGPALEGWYEGVPHAKDTLYCDGKTITPMSEYGFTNFYAYPFNGQIRLQFLSIFDQVRVAKTFVDTGLKKFENPQPKSFSFRISKLTHSSFEGGDEIDLEFFKGGKIRMRGSSGWILGKNYEEIAINCHKIPEWAHDAD